MYKMDRNEANKSVKYSIETVLSAGKVMATVFWISHGTILVGYLEKGKTINGESPIRQFSVMHDERQ